MNINGYSHSVRQFVTRAAKMFIAFPIIFISENLFSKCPCMFTWRMFTVEMVVIVKKIETAQMPDSRRLVKSCCCCSVTKLYPTLCNPMDCSTPGFPVLHYLPEFAQTHVSWVVDAIQPTHPLLPPSPLALSLSQHQGLFQWISSLPQVAKVLEFQLQRQSFQWIFRTDFL